MADHRLLVWARGPAALLFWPLLLTFALSFGLGTAAHRMVFYLMSPVLFIGLWQARTTCQKIVKTPLFYGLVAYLGYFAISILWSVAPAPYDIFRAGVDIACILVFVCALAVWAYHAPYRPSNLQAVVIGVAAIALMYVGLYYGVGGHGVSERIWAYGRYNNPIHLSAVLALAIFVWFVTLERPLARRIRGLTLAVIGVLAIIILLSHTRSTLVAMMAAAGVTVFLGYRRIGFTIIGGLIVCTGLAYLAWGESLAQLIARGDTYRLAIWSQALDVISQAPFIGHGLLFNPQFLLNQPTGPYEAAHNVMLGHMVHGGAIGLLILLALWGRAGYMAMVTLIGTRNGGPDSVKDHKIALLSILMLSFGFVFLQFISSHFVAGLNGQWLVFWMPIGLCLSLEIGRSEIRG